MEESFLPHGRRQIRWTTLYLCSYVRVSVCDSRGVLCYICYCRFLILTDSQHYLWWKSLDDRQLTPEVDYKLVLALFYVFTIHVTNWWSICLYLLKIEEITHVFFICMIFSCAVLCNIDVVLLIHRISSSELLLRTFYYPSNEKVHVDY